MLFLSPIFAKCVHKMPNEMYFCLSVECTMLCVDLCSNLRSETRPAPQERTSATANYSATLHLTNSRALQLVVLVSYKELLSISLLAMH